MAELRVWKMGDRVSITYEGRAVLGQVKLASSNGKSLAIEYEGMLGGYAGLMPVSWNDAEQVFRCLIVGKFVLLEERPK